MPQTVPHRLVAGRAAQTGEGSRQALAELRRLGPGVPPIPDAATADQAFLESRVLEHLGRWDPDRWRLRMQPFGIRSVSPRPGELLMRPPAEFLVDVLHAVMPRWAAEDDDRDHAEVSGIPGLRERHEQGRGILYRPGFPGRIVIPAPRGLWQGAVFVAADLCAAGGHAQVPWLCAPRDWHPAETAFTQAWPDAFSPTGSRYLGSGFASRLLRRLPGLCAAPWAEWHDLWVNHWTDSPAIQFEWENGPVHAAVLERLLDPEFGPGAELELLEGQSAGDCFADRAGRVKVRSAGGHGGWIMLRRVLDPVADVSGLARSLGAMRRAERDAIERAHGYRVARAFLAEPAGIGESAAPDLTAARVLAALDQ